VIMYELLTYSRPFQGESISTILYQILNTEPRAMDPALISQYPELQRIARRAMEKDPQKRYQTMKAMADDIEALQHKLIKKGFHKEDATLIIGDKDTTVLMDTELDFPRSTKKKKSKTLTYSGIGLIVAIASAAVLYFIFFSQPTAPLGTGYLSFDIKPWVVVEKIENMQSGEVKRFPNGDASITPLRISLPPGRYKITYKNSIIGSGDRFKEFEITSQHVTEIRGSISDTFARDAIDHFKISR
jgi:serine/threonine protein kinase